MFPVILSNEFRVYFVRIFKYSLFVLLFSLLVVEEVAAVVVNSVYGLEAAVANAYPGDVILLADGDYKEEIVLKSKGKPQTPVTVRAINSGGAKIHCTLILDGEYLTIEGLSFVEKGYILLLGKGLRITRCTWSDVQAKKWIYGKCTCQKVEIDHCLFENKSNNKDYKRDCQLLKINVFNNGERHHIHHNHFRDIPSGGGNGFETLQIITQENPFDPDPGDCCTLIENNLFERCNGEAEIISIKSNGNVIRGNIFRACVGALVFRHGDGNVASGNLFFGDGEPGTGGIRFQGKDQIIVNNYFSDLNSFALSVHCGTEDNLYVSVERALVSFNTFVNCQYAVILNGDGILPTDCTIANNIFYQSTGSAIKQKSDGDVLFDLGKEEKLDWTWQGNIAWGEVGITNHDGVKKIDPRLYLCENGVAIPEMDSPALEKAVGSYPGISMDILGQVRGQTKTIGAVELPVGQYFKVIHESLK